MRGAGPAPVVAGLALLVLAASVVWTIGPLGRSLRRTPAEAMLDGHGNTGRKVQNDDRIFTGQAWTGPAGDLARVFDLFTPPAIHLDAETGVPRLAADVAGTVVASEPGDGLELVAIRTVVYPLQLVGYAGSGRAARGVFEFTDTGETTLAASGRYFEVLGLTLQSFEVRRARGGDPATATARLVDELSGEEVVLTSLERKTLGPPLAVFRLVSFGRNIECAEGERFDAAGITGEVVRITTDPHEVDVRFTLAERGGTVTRTLRPVTHLP